MRIGGWLAGLALGLTAAAAQGDPTVILLSWDGMRHDGPDRIDAPALARMQREGARAERLAPIFPPNTFPAHVSLATGTHPDRHGILDNAFLDRERGRFRKSDASWIEAEPLWIAAERQGVPSAVFFWVGSETDWRGARPRHRVAPFDGNVGEGTKVDRILSWLDLPPPDRPRLIMSWWHGGDAAGHAYGPDDSSVSETLRDQATHLARLLDGIDARGIWPNTTLLLVSDHGMTNVLGEVALRERVEESGIEVQVSGSSSVSHLYLEKLSERERLEAELAGLDHLTVYRREDLPETLRLGHPTRTGDLVVLPDPGYVFRGGSWRRRAWRDLRRLFGRRTGSHGYAPNHPDMGGVFLALGRGVPAGGELGPVRQIDVAATVARLLGIDPPRDSEGAPIERIGGQSSTGSPR